MCILVVAQPGSIPTREELIMGSCANPHGHGFAVITNDGELVVNRSMEADTLIDEFLELREANMDGYAMFHSRYASQGEISLSNCHPFYLSDNQTVMAHNGNFSNSLQPAGDTRSDTRWFAEDVMPSIGGVKALDNPFISEMIAKWGGSNRIAFLTVNPEAEYDLYLFGEEHGSVDDDGVWWSNDYHRSARYGVGASSKFGDVSPVASALAEDLDEEVAEVITPTSEEDFLDSLNEKEWDNYMKEQSHKHLQYSSQSSIL